MEVDQDYRLITSSESMLFQDIFAGTAINTTSWQNPTTTMTTTVANGFVNLNAAGSVASGAVDQLRTYRHIPTYKFGTTKLEFEAQFTQAPQTNNLIEMGMFLASGTAAPTDGIFFRLSAAGTATCVVSYGGSETASATFDWATLVGTDTTRTFLIYSHTTETSFWIDNNLVAQIANPIASASNTASGNIPIAFRNYNSGATSVAQIMKIGAVATVVGGYNANKDWGASLGGSGGNLSQGQTGGTLGSTAIVTNAAPTAAAAVVNISAAAQFLGLGGIAQVLPTLTVGTPGLLFSYAVPAGTNLVPGRSLVITGINIRSAVTTILAGGPLVYVVSLNYGSTAVSLATAEAATTKAPRRVALGLQAYVVTAAVGTTDRPIEYNCAVSPIYVHPGEFCQISLNNLGTVTTTGAVAFVVNFIGYWE
jgi:hypothetical protein